MPVLNICARDNNTFKIRVAFQCKSSRWGFPLYPAALCFVHQSYLFQQNTKVKVHKELGLHC